jgi:transcriptional regulator with XRE-family HTH domain
MMETLTNTEANVGDMLRQWRHRRGLSQLDLAVDAGISQRHLSFLETGRSAPSRDMALHLAEHLAVPLRDRNAMLTAAGFAPVYRERPLDDPALSAARSAVELILKGHEPYPAIAIDRHWTLLHANQAASRFLGNVDAKLLSSPANVLRISLHPDGLASRIVNYSEWRAHVLARLARDAEACGDAGILALADELKSYPAPANARIQRPPEQDRYGGIAIPLEFDAGGQVLSFISATTMFGSPIDISLDELAIESFFPADEETATAMRLLAQSGT